MALTNALHDRIMREYDEIQFRHLRERDDRREKVYAAIPEMSELDAAAASLALKKARALLYPESEADLDLSAELAGIEKKRTALLASHGWPASYLETEYDCPVCKDTGYADGKKCTCFLQKEIDLLYENSNLQDLSEEKGFSSFSLSYYSEEGSPSPREEAERALAAAEGYVRTFGREDAVRNLCFYGNVGLGKTFLSRCIAKELLAKGRSVLYLPSYTLFEQLGGYHFSNEQELKKELQESHDAVFSCDLLIIDDLGTELINSFTTSQLFLIMNERDLHKRATILSTNIPPAAFEDAFSERISSRLLGSYKLVHLSGTDIRILKKLTGGN
ncbi:MAG: ATP-binding protein [Eubacterium sp.]|nr:ATP-binding protein [Eubacterium sp.]